MTATRAKVRMLTENDTRLRDLIGRAWEAGKSIDIGPAVYGRAIRGGEEVVIESPSTYYPFLAGLAQVTGARSVIEIGTNCGGSALAMSAGMSGAGRIVTLDISDFSDPYLLGKASITKIQGDANSLEVIERVVETLGGVPVDLLYIDAAHSCLPTLLNYCIYGSLFRPRYVILDDITLYETMARMWRLVTLTQGEHRAINAAEVVPAIRPQIPAPGFGVVAFADSSPG
ncbi:MAG: class I SAM-dependent methyltransferase [Dehalococcoidia bacterium]